MSLDPVDQARRLAVHSECPVTRRLLAELLVVIDNQEATIADMKRVNADLNRCNACLNEVAAEAWPK